MKADPLMKSHSSSTAIFWSTRIATPKPSHSCEKAIQNRHDYVPARVVLARALMNLENGRRRSPS